MRLAAAVNTTPPLSEPGVATGSGASAERPPLSRSPARAPVSIVSRSFLASAGERTGVAPLVTTCFGPLHRGRGVHREDLVDDEPVAEHTDRGQVLLHGRDRTRMRPDVGGHVERRDVAQPERASHHPRKCPTARPYAAHVLAFAIRPAKNSRNRATASGPASTITCGRTISCTFPDDFAG